MARFRRTRSPAVASGRKFGTGYTTLTGPATCGATGTAAYTGAPSSMGYPDHYLGGRAPEYINWAFGVQQQLTNAVAVTVTYVGSEGHFLPADGGNARGYWADQLDPKYLSVRFGLAASGANRATACANATLRITCPANFTTSQHLECRLEAVPVPGG